MKKHKNRKYTQEQVDAMNRELELVNAPYRYGLSEKRLVRVELAVMYF